MWFDLAEYMSNMATFKIGWFNDNKKWILKLKILYNIKTHFPLIMRTLSFQYSIALIKFSDCPNFAGVESVLKYLYFVLHLVGNWLNVMLYRDLFLKIPITSWKSRPVKAKSQHSSPVLNLFYHWGFPPTSLAPENFLLQKIKFIFKIMKEMRKWQIENQKFHYAVTYILHK